MTRQEQITLEQVKCKIWDAERRIRQARVCVDSAPDDDSWLAALAKLKHAMRDRHTWTKVLESL